jgi:hypothetical protein
VRRRGTAKEKLAARYVRRKTDREKRSEKHFWSRQRLCSIPMNKAVAEKRTTQKMR